MSRPLAQANRRALRRQIDIEMPCAGGAGLDRPLSMDVVLTALAP